MSSVYITEPATRGKVVLHTSYGDLDVELWPKEAPKAARNFVQLCLEGYYENIVFHRVIKGLFVQTGDPTGTGRGGESIYGAVFPDEFHSRLRFSHRGQVACANMNLPNSNGSQFFITLDKAPWLDKKHTIFGKVTGNTIFNVLRMGDIEVDKDDRPLEPPRLISAEVVDNPFPDIIPRNKAQGTAKNFEQSDTKKATARKTNLRLLSFADDEEDEQVTVPKRRIMSAHELAGGKGGLLAAAAVPSPLHSETAHVEESTSVPISSSKRPRSLPVEHDTVARASTKRARVAEYDDDGSSETEEVAKRSNNAVTMSEEERLKQQLIAAKKMLSGGIASSEVTTEKSHAPNLAEMNAKYAKRGQLKGKEREKDILSRLQSFTSTLKGMSTDTTTTAAAATTYTGQVLEDEELEADVKDRSWMSNKLRFKKHIDDVFRGGNKPVEDDGLMTIDPLAKHRST